MIKRGIVFALMCPFILFIGLSPVVSNLLQDYHDYGYVSLNDYRLRHQLAELKQEICVGAYR